MSAPLPWPAAFDPVFGCELWTGRLDKHGYPRLDNGELAYRAAYVARVGPVPADRELDHTCRRRRCIGHLEAVTRSENELRKSWGYRRRIARCPRGHDLTPYTAMITPEGGRVCRTCRDEDLAGRQK